MERFVDFIYLLYFGSHIPIAMFFDSQAVLPAWIYPKVLRDVMGWYTREFGDAMMAGKPGWFQSFIVFEIFFQFPFFFVAFYAYWKGISKNRWIRLPMIVYSTHVVTSLVCIFHHIFLHDFTKDELKGPSSLKERLQLAAFYLPYFIVPLLLLVDCLFHPIYSDKPSGKSTTGVSQKSNKKVKKQ